MYGCMFNVPCRHGMATANFASAPQRNLLLRPPDVFAGVFVGYHRELRRGKSSG